MPSNSSPMDDVIAALREAAEAAMPGPWRECGRGRGGCSCGTVFSTALDAPVCDVTIGTWGDDWHEIHDDGQSGPQLVHRKMDYGKVPEQMGKATARFIAAANPTVVLAILDELAALRARAALKTAAATGGEG